MTRAWEKPDKRSARVTFSLAQHRINCSIIVGTSPQFRYPGDSFDSKWQQHVQIPINEMSILFIQFDGWGRTEVSEKVERPSRSPREQAFGSPRKKAKEIRFGEAVQIDHEIKLPAAHVFDELNHSHNRERLESVAQPNAIDGDNCVRVA